MTDEQFRALRTLILDVKASIETLAINVRAINKRLEIIEDVFEAEVDPALDIYETEELTELLKTRQPRAPRNDSE